MSNLAGRPEKPTQRDMVLSSLIWWGGWQTYWEIQHYVHKDFDNPPSENTISARLRQLRQEGLVEDRWRVKGKIKEWRAV